jgi:Na+/serine symporter
MGSIGPFGLSLEAGTSGVTGQFDRSVDANPMVSQTFSNSLTFDEEGFSTDESESMSFGMTEGAVVTYTVTLSIPNETIDMVANWFGLGPQSAIRNGGW